jgi:hypothetical protein
MTTKQNVCHFDTDQSHLLRNGRRCKDDCARSTHHTSLQPSSLCPDSCEGCSSAAHSLPQNIGSGEACRFNSSPATILNFLNCPGQEQRWANITYDASELGQVDVGVNFKVPGSSLNHFVDDSCAIDLTSLKKAWLETFWIWSR